MVTFYNIYVKCHMDASVRDVAGKLFFYRCFTIFYNSAIFSNLFLIRLHHIMINRHNITLSFVLDHINYIRGKIGIEHIGVGSDFDGINL